MKNKEDVVSPPIRYTGSKFRAFKYIKPFFENVDFEEYREPFMGCAAVFFRIEKPKYVWLNDKDKDLVLTFNTIKDKKLRELLIKKITNIKPSKEFFDSLKNKTFLDKVDISYKYFVINRTAYGGIMNKPNWGFHLQKSVQPVKWPNLISKSGKKLEGTKITSFDFEKVINAPAKGKKVLMFVDPPYYAADQKRAYTHSFVLKDHLRLAEVLKKTKHKFILTYDNHKDVLDLYSWANVNEVEWMYHTSNSNKTTRKKGKELIITNF